MCDQQMIFSMLFMKCVDRTKLDINFFFLLQRKCAESSVKKSMLRHGHGLLDTFIIEIYSS